MHLLMSEYIALWKIAWQAHERRFPGHRAELTTLGHIAALLLSINI